MKKSEKLLLREIFRSTKNLQKKQRALSIGNIMTLIRSQLRMSQRALAKKAKVPQSSISKIESGILNPNIATLHKIFNALSCNLILSVYPHDDLELIQKRQIRSVAEKKINYLIGTMALEKQKPDAKLIQELIKEEENKLQASNYNIWND
jgi:transcriptional regulator with XRE-family HTH domain